jgi:uncharacterized protein
MEKTLVQLAIHVKNSPLHGYGVFAKENINAGEIIEECYAVALRCKCDIVRDTYSYDKNGKGLLLTGYGSIYNHSDEPNTKFLTGNKDENFFTFEAIKNIRQGEEVLISYGKHYDYNLMKPIRSRKRFKFLKIISGWPLRSAAIIGSYFLFLSLLRNADFISLVRHVLHF